MASAAGTLYGAFNWPVVIADATRALAIDPTLELGHVVRMRAFFHLGLFDRMTDEARAAYRLNPLGNVEIARLEVRREPLYRCLSGARANRPRRCSLAALMRRSFPTISGWRSSMRAKWPPPAQRWPPCSERAAPTSVRKPPLQGSRRPPAITPPPARRVLAIEAGPYMDHHVAYSLGAAWAQLGDAGCKREMAPAGCRHRLPLLSLADAGPAARSRSDAILDSRLSSTGSGSATSRTSPGTDPVPRTASPLITDC